MGQKITPVPDPQELTKALMYMVAAGDKFTVGPPTIYLGEITTLTVGVLTDKVSSTIELWYRYASVNESYREARTRLEGREGFLLEVIQANKAS